MSKVLILETPSTKVHKYLHTYNASSWSEIRLGRRIWHQCARTRLLTQNTACTCLLLTLNPDREKLADIWSRRQAVTFTQVSDDKHWFRKNPANTEHTDLTVKAFTWLLHFAINRTKHSWALYTLQCGEISRYKLLTWTIFVLLESHKICSFPQGSIRRPPRRGSTTWVFSRHDGSPEEKHKDNTKVCTHAGFWGIMRDKIKLAFVDTVLRLEPHSLCH